MLDATALLKCFLVAVVLAYGGSAAAAELHEWDFGKTLPPKVALPPLDDATKSSLASQPRYALVIGNGSGYSATPIAKVDQDASSMAAMLKHLGFRVYGKVNATGAEMERLVNDFAEMAGKVDGASIVFYYSGHGVQVDGGNYLIPVDMRAGGDEITVKHSAFSLAYALDRLRAVKGPRIIILDACRDNPYVQSFKSAVIPGLAKVSAGPGSLVAFATEAGKRAWVGGDDHPHTLFTEQLLKALGNPRRSIDDILKSTQSMVEKASAGQQVSEFTYALGEIGYYIASPAPAPAPAPRPDAVMSELVRAVQTSTEEKRVFSSASEECMWLAAPKRYPYGKAPGVNLDKINFGAALGACGRAMREAPNAHSKALYGRTLLKEKRYDEALPHIEAAAQEGDAVAQAWLSIMYEKGNGLRKDLMKAGYWLKKSADGGFIGAQSLLGWAHYEGKIVEKDMRIAVDLLKRAAELGDDWAQMRYGVFYSRGEGVPKDYNEFLRWTQLAADQGNSLALSNLGAAYLEGLGVSKDYNKARQLFEKAAALGNASAMSNLGCVYYNGWGVQKDRSKAVEWYWPAAELGDTKAQSQLACMYANGEGATKRLDIAEDWYRKAAASGCEKSKQWLLDRRLPSGG